MQSIHIHTNEEERDLDKDGQQQDELVDTVDNQGRSDALKRLPAKDTNELPCEETKDDQSNGVDRQEGDLINVARTPSTREEVDSVASAVAGQTVEFRTEAGGVPDLEACPCRSQTVGEESGDAEVWNISMRYEGPIDDLAYTWGMDSFKMATRDMLRVQIWNASSVTSSARVCLGS